LREPFSWEVVDTTATPSRDIQQEYEKQILQDEENWRREQYGLPPVEYELQKIDKMDGNAFEYWCADLLRQNGFVDVEVTPGSNDQGVDVLAKKDGIKYAVQCKCYSSDLGNTPVQEVNAGKAVYHCHVGVVMTNRYFTKGAQNVAEATGTLLWDRDIVTDMLKTVAP
jgi:restriction system protein